MQETIEAIDLQATLQSGVYRDLVHSCSVEPDAIETTVEFTGGDIREIVHTGGAGIDAIEFSGLLIGGTYRDVVVEYTMQPEAIDTTVSLIAGTYV